MTKYKKNYLKHHNLTEWDFIACAICPKPSNDFHHIHIKGMGGRKTIIIDGSEYSIDDPINIIPLCREHHKQAHAGRWTKDELMKFNLLPF